VASIIDTSRAWWTVWGFHWWARSFAIGWTSGSWVGLSRWNPARNCRSQSPSGGGGD